MSIDYEIWREKHDECVFSVLRLCELDNSKESSEKSIKCRSAMCVMNHAMQDINSYFLNTTQSSAELCFLIRNIDVIITSILDINNILLGVGLNKPKKAIERCFVEKDNILKFRTLRSLVLAHPVDTYFNNDRGESVTIYLEDFRPYNTAVDRMVQREKCDYLKILCDSETEERIYEPIVLERDIIPVINNIINSVEILINKINNQIKVIENTLVNKKLIIARTNTKEYINSLACELEKRYPSTVEILEYEDGIVVKNSIISDCLIYFDVDERIRKNKKYDLFLDYLKRELKVIELDLQSMKYNENKYFKLLYNKDFASGLSYEKEKMEYLRVSIKKSYTEDYIGNGTQSDALWGIRCFRMLKPYIEEYITVETSVNDKELYCQYVAAEYLSNVL